MPKIYHANFGDVQDHVFIRGTIDVVYGPNEEDPSHRDTVDVTVGNVGLEARDHIGSTFQGSHIPLFYHCDPDSELREEPAPNGAYAIVGASAAFYEGDYVIVMCSGTPDHYQAVRVVGFYVLPDETNLDLQSRYFGGIRPCLWESFPSGMDIAYCRTEWVDGLGRWAFYNKLEADQPWTALNVVGPTEHPSFYQIGDMGVLRGFDSGTMESNNYAMLSLGYGDWPAAAYLNDNLCCDSHPALQWTSNGYYSGPGGGFPGLDIDGCGWNPRIVETPVLDGIRSLTLKLIAIAASYYRWSYWERECEAYMSIRDDNGNTKRFYFAYDYLYHDFTVAHPGGHGWLGYADFPNDWIYVGGPPPEDERVRDPYNVEVPGRGAADSAAQPNFFGGFFGISMMTIDTVHPSPAMRESTYPGNLIHRMFYPGEIVIDLVDAGFPEAVEGGGINISLIQFYVNSECAEGPGGGPIQF